MITQELVEEVASRFQQGERRESIMESLQSLGWTETDINEAISYIQRTALLEIPVVSSITKTLQTLDAKTSQLPTKTIVGFFAGIGLLLLTIALVLFYSFDPIGFRAAPRDKQREDAFNKISAAINKYYSDKNSYPSSLKLLTPGYLPEIPTDPKTGKEYPYRILGKGDYELCIYFETQNFRCISSADPSSSVPIVFPTATPFAR